MDRIAKLSNAEREKLFLDVYEISRIPLAMVEKDFWVCWVLSRLFADEEMTRILRFKGGTSLSKGYRLIERFSEDLDIILAKEQVLGEGEDLFQPSNKKQRHFADEISARTAHYITTTLKDKITPLLGDTVEIFTDEEYAKANPHYEAKDSKLLHVVYPKVTADTYLRPDILLEIGIMSAWVPNEPCEILPYIANAYPHLEIASAIVPTIKAQRTFWDKASILHREFYRKPTTHTPARYSRHYYDLYQMARSAMKAAALADCALLADVVSRKDRLYHCAWARYELAKPGTLRLLPNEHNHALLARDYQAMRGMIFGDAPEWETILAGLQKLEDEINNLESNH